MTWSPRSGTGQQRSPELREALSVQELPEKGQRLWLDLLLQPGHDLLRLRCLFPLRGLADRSGADDDGGSVPVSTDAAQPDPENIRPDNGVIFPKRSRADARK